MKALEGLPALQVRKKKQRRKKQRCAASLSDEKLEYLSFKITEKWRRVGEQLGVTHNRMDMIEMDIPLSVERQTLTMLKVKGFL